MLWWLVTELVQTRDLIHHFHPSLLSASPAESSKSWFYSNRDSQLTFLFLKALAVCCHWALSFTCSSGTCEIENHYIEVLLCLGWLQPLISWLQQPAISGYLLFPGLLPCVCILTLLLLLFTILGLASSCLRSFPCLLLDLVTYFARRTKHR